MPGLELRNLPATGCRDLNEFFLAMSPARFPRVFPRVCGLELRNHPATECSCQSTEDSRGLVHWTQTRAFGAFHQSYLPNPEYSSMPGLELGNLPGTLTSYTRTEQHRGSIPRTQIKATRAVHPSHLRDPGLPEGRRCRTTRKRTGLSTRVPATFGHRPRFSSGLVSEIRQLGHECSTKRAMGDTVTKHLAMVDQPGPILAETLHVGGDARHIRLQCHTPCYSRFCPWWEPLPKIGGFH